MTSILLAVAIAPNPGVQLFPHRPDEDDAGPRLQAAIDALEPGETLSIDSGTYALKTPVDVAVVGSPEAPIVIEGVIVETVLDGTGYVPGPRDDLGNSGLITFRQARHVVLRGITVRNSHRGGIMLKAGCVDIVIEDSASHGSFAPGIGAWNSRDVVIRRNEVTQANDQAYRLYGSRERECPHEAISVAGVDGFVVEDNHVHHSIKEGIDVKEVSRRGVVRHNHIHDLGRQGLYADAWFGELFDVEFHDNLVHDCEWGMVISAEGQDAELRDVRVHHNVFVDNRASGFYLGLWGGDGPRTKIDLYNNTFVNNGDVGHWSGATGNIDLRSRNVTDVVVANNICVGGGAFDIAAVFAEPSELERRGFVVRNNLVSRTDVELGKTEGYARARPFATIDTRVGVPQFVDRGAYDLSLVPGSPAEGWAWSSDRVSPRGADVGACPDGGCGRPWPYSSISSDRFRADR